MDTTSRPTTFEAPPETACALVDPRWLSARLSDPDVCVVEVDVSSAAYDDWHIDGAVLWNIYTDLRDAEYRPVGAAPVEQLVQRSGIRPDTTVVFYGYAPALGFWLLRRYGHTNVCVLDCDRESWRAEGHPWSTVATEPMTTTYPLGDEDVRITADRADVRDAVGQAGALLVDVRSTAEYEGERFWPSGGQQPNGRAGHVPSAVHQPIDGVYDDHGSFRDVGELRQVFTEIDLDDDEVELITYCTIGGRAATTWFVLTQLLGRDRVKVYEGSWAEWGLLADSPVVATRPGPS
jgi:thiosulfate/3-mercaptopyruvate sulfurtransferase